MKKIILGLAAITFLGLASCKKDKSLQQNNDISLNSDGFEKSTSVGNTARIVPVSIYQASQSSLANSSNTFITSVINQINNSGSGNRPGYYSIFSNSNSVIASVINNTGQCIGSAPTLEITYQITTIESQGVTYGLNYNATLLLSTNIMSIPASSYTELSSQIFDNSSETICGIPIVTRVSNVKFTVPTSNYENSVSSYVDIIATSNGPAQAPSTISQFVSLTFPSTYYTNQPAFIDINSVPSENSFTVSTQCALVCNVSIHTECPTGGYFSYRLAGSTGPYITVSLNSDNTTISAAMGAYEYICVLYYSFGNSSPKTGLFNVN